MHITYQNLAIRNAAPEDASLLCRWWNDGRVMAHAGYPNGLNMTPQRIAQNLASDSDETRRRLMIEVDSVPVGEMSYRNMGQGVAQIGIKICDFSQQEQGHGTRFLKMLITGLFAAGYEEITLDTNLTNTRAQHVYEKIGFRKLRVNHNSFKDQLGALQSSVDYALRKSQFSALDVASFL